MNNITHSHKTVLFILVSFKSIVIHSWICDIRSGVCGGPPDWRLKQIRNMTNKKKAKK